MLTDDGQQGMDGKTGGGSTTEKEQGAVAAAIQVIKEFTAAPESKSQFWLWAAELIIKM
ncbi:hypothetical protein [Yersinia ruckeri]|uniref:hypothetical protein n=1 Tax=Yersinia ruckeri TaxID=29486 RepID=UPI000AB94F83|nr:hypothetical protein [Yersinia ruckeri]